MKARQARFWAPLAVTAMIGGASGSAIWFHVRAQRFSSPTEERVSSAILRKSWHSLPATWTDANAEVEYAIVDGEPYPDAIEILGPNETRAFGVVLPKSKESTDSRKVTLLRTRRIGADGGRVAELPGGGRIELLATSVLLPTEQEEEGQFHYFNTRTGDLVSDRQLLDWGSEDVELARAQFGQPRMLPTLRLLFRVSGLDFVRLSDGEGFDARTRFNVFEDHQRVARPLGEGLWAVDRQLRIWHDTPLDVAIDLPIGTMKLTRIDQARGFQTSLDGHGWFQLLDFGAPPLGPGSDAPTSSSRGVDAFDYAPMDASDFAFHGFHALCRLQPSAALQTALIWEPESGHRLPIWFHANQEDQLEALSFPADPEQTDLPPRQLLDEGKLELAHFPERARVWFHIPALPQMQNSRAETTNLFDIRLRCYAPLLDSRELLDTVASAAELELDWTSGVEMIPRDVDSSFEFAMEETTPRTLLDQFQRAAPDAVIQVDRSKHRLTVAARQPSWPQRLKSRWDAVVNWIKE